MRNLLLIGISIFIANSAFSQSGVLKTYNFNKKPAMIEDAAGIWQPFKTSWYDETDSITYENIPRHTDSIYINTPGLPNFGDLNVPDLEVKIKSLWVGDSIFFLFQRLDDISVTGYTAGGDVDETVLEGLENRDASTLYFYFSSDSARQDTVFNYSDSIAWLRFVWQSDDVLGRLPSGDSVESWAGFHAESIQWCDGPYCYAKIGISLGELAPHVPEMMDALLSDLGVAYFGFTVDVTDNDKEIEPAPYGIQTKAHWYADMGESVLDDVPEWGWLWFYHDTLNFTTGVKNNSINLASVYPNPVSDYLNVSLNGFEQGSYSIFDLTGRTIITGILTGRDNSVYVGNIYQGTYFIRISDSNNNFSTLKFIKTL
jgi:hypothetical protein